jgi:hypothetical protein
MHTLQFTTRILCLLFPVSLCPLPMLAARHGAFKRALAGDAIVCNFAMFGNHAVWPRPNAELPGGLAWSCTVTPGESKACVDWLRASGAAAGEAGARPQLRRHPGTMHSGGIVMTPRPRSNDMLGGGAATRPAAATAPPRHHAQRRHNDEPAVPLRRHSWRQRSDMPGRGYGATPASCAAAAS